MRELSDATGLNQPSLYNAFGDKHALFAASLERYANRSMRARIKRTEAEYPPSEAIRVFFRELVSMSLSDKDRRGCMIVNSALEVAPHDVALRATIASYLGEIQGFVLRCLERARRDGELPPQLDVADTARLFLGVVLGLRVLARAKPTRTLLEGMVRPAVALLDLPKKTSGSLQ
jgi:TetR/AcrR family transcriptional repressor of nem operon